MATLQITIEQQTFNDYNDVPQTVKLVSGKIDGVDIAEHLTAENIVSDAQVKTNFKTFLTAKGYTWDAEI